MKEYQMIYQIQLNLPIFNLWSGLFSNNKNQTWRHKETHHSENFELILPIKNDVSLTINEKEVLIKENECFLIPPYAKIKAAATIEHEVHFYWLHFIASYQTISLKEPMLQKGLQDLATLTMPTELNNFIFLPQRFQLKYPERIVVLLNQLLTNGKRQQYTQRGNDFSLTLLLIALCDDYLNQLAHTAKNHVKKTALIAEWIRVNLTSELHLSDIANHFGLNPNYLSRLFKKEQGIGIKEYMVNIKIDYAKTLLATTNLSVNEVADQAFFSDAKHFMRTFKQKNGLTPSDYRAENAQTNLNSSQMNLSAPLPQQLGNEALKKLIYQILKENHQ